jgi:hypothetical protein
MECQGLTGRQSCVHEPHHESFQPWEQRRPGFICLGARTDLAQFLVALAQPFSFSTAFHSRRSEKITKSLMLSCRFAAYLRIFAACSTVQRK